MTQEYAGITGASIGLGLTYAKELSSRSINTILVGLEDEGLAETCEQLKTEFSIDSVFFETDLTVLENIESVAKQINDKYSVFMLINNAGLGGTKRFTDANIGYLDSIIQLNVRATAMVTHQLLPNLLKREKAFVLNVSSIAAFSPIGFKTVYPASKAFIDHFTRGLSRELSKTNVTVSLVSPGPMLTSQEKIDRLAKQGWLGQLVALTPQKVAQVSVHQLLKGDTAIVLNAFNLLNLLLMRFVSRRYITWRVRQELETGSTEEK
jgi:short-subunit dehydrogenase